jgi:hypothetical protein
MSHGANQKEQRAKHRGQEVELAPEGKNYDGNSADRKNYQPVNESALKLPESALR